MSLATRETHTRRILDKVADGQPVSQRSLSRELGIALGLTNLLLRRLAAKGWIRIIRFRPNRVGYILTPAGLVQKARLSRAYLLNSLRFYTEARDRVQHRFEDMVGQSGAGATQSIVFYGSGEIAEVAWLCLQRTKLQLVGVVDDKHVGRDFFGFTVQPTSALQSDSCNARRYDRIVVMALDQPESTRATLDRAGIPDRRIFWL